LVWLQAASAEEDAADTAPAPDAATQAVTAPTVTQSALDASNTAPADVDNAVPTPPAPRIAVQPYRDKVDRTKVEKRLEDKGNRTKQRAVAVEKDASERAAKAQQNQANVPQN
jgi:hypothetical protein